MYLSEFLEITFFLTDLNAVDWDVPIAAIGVLLLSQHTLSGQFRQQHLFKVSSLNLDWMSKQVSDNQ